MKRRTTLLLAALALVTAACGQSPTAPVRAKAIASHPSTDGTAPADTTTRSGIGFGGGH